MQPSPKRYKCLLAERRKQVRALKKDKAALIAENELLKKKQDELNRHALGLYKALFGDKGTV